MIKPMLQVVIIGGSRGQKCDADCGIDWSLPETTALAHQRLKENFGDRVRLQYLDLSQVVANHALLAWRQVSEDKNLALPLLLINGQLRISGQFDLRQLRDAVEAEIEIGD